MWKRKPRGLALTLTHPLKVPNMIRSYIDWVPKTLPVRVIKSTLCWDKRNYDWLVSKNTIITIKASLPMMTAMNCSFLIPKVIRPPRSTKASETIPSLATHRKTVCLKSWQPLNLPNRELTPISNLQITLLHEESWLTLSWKQQKTTSTTHIQAGGAWEQI